MKKRNNILILDVGTTGVKSILFDKDLTPVARTYIALRKKSWNGRVEQDPGELLRVSIKVLKNTLRKSRVPVSLVDGLGITNQRETTILWDKRNGKAIYPAIVWEDTRTLKNCKKLRLKYGRMIRKITGLTLDPYFSASKIQWILENVPQAQKLIAEKNLLFGTVDSWILWNLLDDRPHLTDETNASRTLLFNIQKRKWDTWLLNIFNVPKDLLPEVRSSMSFFGNVHKNILGRSLPVLAVCGDQQASLFAAGLKPGTTKVTYGTGSFVSQVLGKKFVFKEPFFTTLAPSSRGAVYVLEAKVNDCGERVAAVLDSPKALRTVVSTIIREVNQYLKKLPLRPKGVVVDGGVTKYEDFTLLQERITGLPVVRQRIYDGTALGVAMLVKQSKKIHDRL